MKKLSLFLVSLIVIASMLVGCAGSMSPAEDQAPGENSGGYYEGGAPAAPAPADMPEEPAPEPDRADGEGFMPSMDDSEQVTDIAEQMGSKIIKSGYISVETLDFVETTSAITRRVQQVGGFVASSNVQGWSREDARYKPNRRANYRLRIPSDKFEQFMTDVGNLGNVTQSENWGEDISGKYFDTEARLQSLTIQEERLLTILSKAEKLSDIIELERELSSVRYEIENLTGTLRKYDNLVAYSTLEIDVIEVEEITEIEEKPVTLWEKIVHRLENSIKNTIRIAEALLLFLISAIPFLLLLGIVLLVILILIRIIRRNIQKHQKKQISANFEKIEEEENKE